MALPLTGRDLPPHLMADPLNHSFSSSSSSSTPPTPLPPFLFSVPSKLGPETPSSGNDLFGDTANEEVGGHEDEENIFRDMNWEEILEDLNARFLINLPKEEMSLVRVYWQAEQAHWFYEDYLRPLNPLLPSLSQRNFTRLIIESSPLYKQLMKDGGLNYDRIWEEYCSYKRMVPCCGGILINRDGDKCLMVRGYKSNAGWSFPRGKINLEESEEACAIREVEEETGFDLTGLIQTNDKIKTHINAQEVTMFIIKGIDENTVFETQTRNEIGAIEWVRLMDLPTWMGRRGPKRTGGQGQKRFYNVTPFVNPLKTWLKEHGINPYMKPKKAHQATNVHRDLQPYQFESPTMDTSSPVLSRDTSALDHLFSRFIHKQEEELEAPSQVIAVGSDNKAGLERLFGNLNVLQEEERSISKAGEKSDHDKEREKREDYDLAKLLGSIGRTETPASEPPKPIPSTQKQSNLLAMLNQPAPQPDESPQLPSQSATSPAKSHQARLLSMFSPVAIPSSPPHLTLSAEQAQSKMGFLSTSLHALSTPQNHQDVQRQAKARALLESTLSGIGLDGPIRAALPNNAVPQPQGLYQTGSRISGMQQQLGHSGTQGQTSAQFQHGPPSGYGQYPQTAYRSIPPSPLQDHGSPARPPVTDSHDNHTRSHQPNTPYDTQIAGSYAAADHHPYRHGPPFAPLPLPTPGDLSILSQRPPPPLPPIFPTRSDYRPDLQHGSVSGPFRGQAYPAHLGPGSSLDGALLPHVPGPLSPPTGGAPHAIGSLHQPAHHLQHQSYVQGRTTAGLPPNYVNQTQSHQQLQFAPQTLPDDYQGPLPSYAQVEWTSPTKHNGPIPIPNVHHPIPRPTGGAQGLLAMLNGRGQGR
ncbi:hypothetical protein IAR55_006309 [Kwoniella newhampshirensis]|uniref:Nudix hydrolase domain-containing protein n=1 Tax=Kwoniella newhampshirensis TaxID=1651941 RepID=A0AAW0YSF4_9TREE